MEVLAQAAGEANTAEVILFWVFSVIGLGAAIAMVTMRNIVHAALMLVINLLAIAALYLGLQSAFLSIVQVIVYAGAIMVLFLFVIMLLGVDRDDLLFGTSAWSRVGAVLGAAALAAAILVGIAGTYTTAASRCGSQAAEATTTTDAERCVGMDDAILASEQGAVGLLSESLFTRYTFPFEAAAVLLTVATIGAMLLGRRHDVDQDDDPAWAPSARRPTSEDVAKAEEQAAPRGDLQGEGALYPTEPERRIYERLKDPGEHGTEMGTAGTPDEPGSGPGAQEPGTNPGSGISGPDPAPEERLRDDEEER